jgi:hypothetical protein
MHSMETEKDFRPGIEDNTGGSVTQWISALKQGDQSVARSLWEA